MKIRNRPVKGSKPEPGIKNPIPADPAIEELFNMVPDLLCVASSDGYFKKLNPAWEDVLGYKREEMYSHPFSDFIHPDDLDQTMKEVESQLAGNETTSLINRYRTKDNSYKWLEWRAKASPDKTELYAVARDITKRKMADQSLNDFKERYEIAFRTSPDAININKMDGTYIDINNGFTELTGFTKEDVIGISSLDLNIWAVDKDRKELVKRLKKHGSVKNMESVFRCKDGSLKTALMSASIIQINQEPHILSITHDITERIVATNALRESEEKYRLLAVNSKDIIWQMDMEGKFTYVSPSVERFQGFTPEESLAHGFEGSLTPESAKIAKKTLVESVKEIQSGSSLSDLTLTLEHIHKNGSVLWAEVTVNKMVNDNNELIGFVGITRDITERRKTEQILRRTMAAVESASDAIGISDEDGRHIYHNEAMTRLLGYATAEEFSEAGAWKACVQDADAGAHIYQSLLQGSSWRGETEMISKTGKKFQAFVRADSIKHENGKFIGLVGIITDITERVRTENRLKQSEEIFRLLAEYSPNMIFIISDNKISYVNDLCAKKLGYTKEELFSPGFDFLTLVAPENKKPFKENLIRLASGKEIEPFEFLMSTKEGKRLYTMVNAKPIQMANEKAILGVVMDISEQKWAEEILKRKATQFEHFSTLMVDRELKMVELKKEVNHLLEKLGEPSKYPVYEGDSLSPE